MVVISPLVMEIKIAMLVGTVNTVPIVTPEVGVAEFVPHLRSYQQKRQLIPALRILSAMGRQKRDRGVNELSREADIVGNTGNMQLEHTARRKFNSR